MACLQTETLRPLTLEDLETAKTAILQELRVLGRNAADRLREHIVCANAYHAKSAKRPARPRCPPTSQPARVTDSSRLPPRAPFPNPGPSPLRPPAMVPRPVLNRDTLETLFQQQCVDQLATDAQLPSRWERELERRLQAHTPTPSATPFHSTGTNCTPLSTCPPSPLITQPCNHRSRLGYVGADDGAGSTADVSGAVSPAPPAAAVPCGAATPTTDMAATNSKPRGCHSAQRLCSTSNPDGYDSGRGVDGGDAGGDRLRITVGMPPQPAFPTSCHFRQDADARQGADARHGVIRPPRPQPASPPWQLLTPSELVPAPAEDLEGAPTVERPPLPAAAVAAAGASASASPGGAGFGPGGNSGASSGRGSPEHGSRRKLPTQLVEEIVRQLFTASSGGVVCSPAAAAPAGAASGVGAYGGGGQLGSKRSIRLMDCNGGLRPHGGAAARAGYQATSGSVSEIFDVAAACPEPWSADGAACVAGVHHREGARPSVVGRGLGPGLLLRESWTDPEPISSAHGSSYSPPTAAVPFWAAETTEAQELSTPAVAEASPLTSIRTRRAAVGTHEPGHPPQGSPDGCMASLAAVSGCSSSGVASPGGSGGTSMTPSYHAASPYISTPPSSWSTSGPATSYASPVLRGSVGDEGSRWGSSQ